MKHWKTLPYGCKKSPKHWIDGNEINKKAERQQVKKEIADEDWFFLTPDDDMWDED